MKNMAPRKTFTEIQANMNKDIPPIGTYKNVENCYARLSKSSILTRVRRH